MKESNEEKSEKKPIRKKILAKDFLKFIEDSKTKKKVLKILNNNNNNKKKSKKKKSHLRTLDTTAEEKIFQKYEKVMSLTKQQQ